MQDFFGLNMSSYFFALVLFHLQVSISFMRSMWSYCWSFESCDLCFIIQHKKNHGHTHELYRVHLLDVLHPHHSCPKAEKQKPIKLSSADLI